MTYAAICRPTAQKLPKDRESRRAALCRRRFPGTALTKQRPPMELNVTPS